MRAARRLVFVVACSLAVLASGCGDGDDDDVGAGSASDPAAATVAVASTSLGDVLVDGEGRTLYLFTNDQGGTSSCTGACASAWPSVEVSGDPVAGDGVDEAKLATNADGQVTYAGRPLYRYAADAKAGDVRGHGVGGVWFAVDAEGDPVDEEQSTDEEEDDVAPTPSY